MSNASPQQINEFVREVDAFMLNYSRLSAPDTRVAVYASGNAALIADYESQLSKSASLKSAIETTVGAWNAAKTAYAKITDSTSMVIGDAIDEIRSWFGYNPGGVMGLGLLQLPAAALSAVWIGGIVAAAYLLNQSAKKLFVSIEATRLQRDNPALSREQALNVAGAAIASQGFLASFRLPLLAAGLLAAWLLLGKRK